MALGVVIPQARQVALDANGDPLPGAKMESWLAGTSTPQPLFTTDQLNIQLSNPVVADGNGVFPAMFTEPVALKLELRTAADAVIWNQDDITPANLLTGQIASEEPTGHAIGDTTPAATQVGMFLGGTIPIAAPNVFGVGFLTQQDFDASAQAALLYAMGMYLRSTMLLAASGTPVVAGLTVDAPAISSGGAVPSVASALTLQGMPGLGTLRYTLLCNGFAKLDGGLELGEDVTPTQLTANQNNYSPTGIADAYLLRLSSDASRNITGLLAAGAGASHQTLNQRGRTLWIANVGAFNIVLTNEDAASTAANRFANPGAASFTLTPGLCCQLHYDGTSSRWRVVG